MSELNLVNKSFCLHQLFESNYNKLLCLVPDLHSITSPIIIAQPNNKPKLRLSVLEQGAFTLEVQLTYHCNSDINEIEDADSSVNIRIYLDSKTAEIITFRPELLSLPATDYPKAALNAKWSLNYQLDKWLTHCLSQGYQLIETKQSQAIPA